MTATTMTTSQEQQTAAAVTAAVPLATSSATLATFSPPPSSTTMSHVLGERRRSAMRRPRSITVSTASSTTTPKTRAAVTTTAADSLTSVTNLSERLIGDVAVGTAVTAAVAPFLTVVDKALVQRSNASASLMGSAATSLAQMVKHPISFLKSPTYLWMWATYAATYSTANALRTITEHREYGALKQASSQQQRELLSQQQKQATTATLFVGTTIVNSTASVVKDQAYARMFGNAATGAVPRISYALWMSRDFTVIGSSFIMPEYVSRHLQSHCGGDLSPERATAIAQIGTPLLAQVIAGPLHFVGLDCYNRSLSGLSLQRRLAERGRFLMGGFAEVVAARMARILPGYGIAGVGNKALRTKYREYLIRRKVKDLVVGEKRQNKKSSPSATSAAAGDLVALIRAKKAA